MRSVSLRLFALIALATASLGGVPAHALDKPADRPILTVSGAIGTTNADGTAQFDRAMLEALGMVSFQTGTPWYDTPVTFEGVPIAAIMKAVAAKGDRLVVTALNDYSSEIPMEDVTRYGVILALKRNGEYMPVRDKGPLFVIYNFDKQPELKNPKYYTRSVWQVRSIDVK